MPKVIIEDILNNKEQLLPENILKIILIKHI
jgi:hypothetical protein